ncbi:MAG: C25 family cysteine peptidase [Pyrinomonadaceae bacterium]
MKKNNLPKRKRNSILIALLLGLSIVYSPFALNWKTSAAGTISGRVFQDFNGNGNYDTTLTIPNDGLTTSTIGVAIDKGLQGVTVTAYDSAGAARGTTTTITGGTYSLTTTDAGSGPYRIEFTNLPAGYYPSARNTDSVGSGIANGSGSTVQFASTPSTNVNLAVNYPADYSQNNPEVAASLYQAGSQVNNVQPVLVSFPYSAGSTDTATGAVEANFDQPTAHSLSLEAQDIGTTSGLAYARNSRLIYAGAYFKRHVGFGTGGPNAIYVINRTGTGSVTNTFTVPGTATNAHNTADYSRDNGNTGWDGVGKTSLGGMTMSEDESRLYVINLANRTLYALNPNTGAQIISQATPTNLPLATGTCAATDARPFAVNFYHGQLYVGMVCSAESSTQVDTYTDANTNGQYDGGDYFIDQNGDNIRQTTEPFVDLDGDGTFDNGEIFVDNDGNGVYNLGDARKLYAYIYQVNPATLAFGTSPVFSAPLNYRRGITTHSQGAFGGWRPWSNIYRNSSSVANRTVYSQPMLTDIAFDNGNLILGLRDRISDQVGNGSLSNPNDPSATNFYQPRTAGDVLRACGNPTSGWTLEVNGRCGGTGNAPQNTSEGPGKAEFYFGDSYDLADVYTTNTGTVTINGKGGNHDDTGNGGVEQLPGAPDVIISNFDPIPNIANMTHDGGVRWLSNTTGDFTKAYRLYNGNGNDANVFGKAGGIGGNLLILPNPAPIELGNRVWRDTNGNGVQDAGENGIAGVSVRLYQGSTLLGTAVTDANGEYYFSSAAGTNTANAIYGLNIQPNTTYQLRLDVSANYAAGGALNSLFLTTKTQTSQAGFAQGSDSDAASVTNPAGSPAGTFPVISVTTGSAGDNNHNLDTGFAPFAVYSLGNRLWYDTNNDGQINAGEVGVADVSVSLLNSSSAVMQTVITDADGYYRFDGLAAGNYSVRANSSNFANNAALAGYQDTTITNATNMDSTSVAGQNGENGINPTGAANSIQTNGISSGTVTLGPGQPTGEVDVQATGQGAADAAANMTVDLGFYCLSLSGTVWNDSGAGANNNNGIQDTGENGIQSIKVQLYGSTGTEILVGPDGVLGTSDDAAGGILSNSSGNYNFQCLPQGQYRVVVTSSGANSSTPTSTNPDNNIDKDDNGFPDNTGNFTGKTISGLVTLTPGTEAAKPNKTVTNTNGSTSDPTVDFGFVLSPTAIKLESFDAFTNGNGVVLKWSTGDESSNLGFNVYREVGGERQLLNAAPVAGSALRTSVNLSATSDNYSWTDKNAESSAVYYLEDIDLNGSKTLHGPVSPTFKTAFDNLPTNAKLLSDLAQIEMPSAEKEIIGSQNTDNANADNSPANQSRQRQIAAQTGVKISVNHDAWYRVSAEQLSAAGFDTDSKRYFWQLLAGGEQVPMKLNSDGSIEFFGRGLDTPTADTQVYYLVKGRTAGLRVREFKGGNAGDAADARSFGVTVKRKDRTIYSSAILNGDEENWFGAVITQAGPTVQNLTVNNFSGNGNAHLNVKLQGVTTAEHYVNIKFNDVELGTVNLSNTQNREFGFDLPASALREGANRVNLQSVGTGADINFVDTISLSYQRNFAATNNRLRFSVPAGQTARVGGFSNEIVSVFEIQNGNAVRQLVGSSENTGDSYGFSLSSVGYDRELLAVTDENVEPALKVERNTPSNWHSSINEADFVIITSDGLRDSADRLASIRNAQGLKTRVVLIDDLYDEFSFGARTPEAVKQFLKLTASEWKLKPRYALLFGDSSYDPRNRLGLTTTRDVVPTKSVDTDNFETASDAWLADFDNDGIEDIALGRLPAATLAEANAMVDKLIRYDNQTARLEKSDVLVADRGFENYNTALQNILPNNVRSSRINRAEMSDADMHNAVLTQLNANPMVVTYTGHGSTVAWSNTSVFSANDTAGLSNRELSFYVMMTCLNGYTHNANNDSLAEAAVKAENGAIAVWASSGITFSENQFQISQSLTNLIFNAKTKSVRIGEIVKAAKQNTADKDVRQTWQLIGDPTIVIK